MTRRNSLQTIHEPFGDAFYFGPERMGARFENDEESREKSGFANSTFASILDRVEREAAEVGSIRLVVIHFHRPAPLAVAQRISHPLLLHSLYECCTLSLCSGLGYFSTRALHDIDRKTDRSAKLFSSSDVVQLPPEIHSQRQIQRLGLS